MTGPLLALGVVAVVCAVDVLFHRRRVRRALREFDSLGRDRL